LGKKIDWDGLKLFAKFKKRKQILIINYIFFIFFLKTKQANFKNA